MAIHEPPTAASPVGLRDVAASDLPLFFEFHRDPVANEMAAFTAEDPSDREAFNAHWARIMAAEKVTIRTILVDGQVAGSVLSYDGHGDREVAYWIGREFWGRGIATEALALFLQEQTTRPLYGRVAQHNIGSLRVLEKNGFILVGEDKGFANAKGEEIEEYILKLGHEN